MFNFNEAYYMMWLWLAVVLSLRAIAPDDDDDDTNKADATPLVARSSTISDTRTDDAPPLIARSPASSDTKKDDATPVVARSPTSSDTDKTDDPPIVALSPESSETTKTDDPPIIARSPGSPETTKADAHPLVARLSKASLTASDPNSSTSELSPTSTLEGSIPDRLDAKQDELLQNEGTISHTKEGGDGDYECGEVCAYDAVSQTSTTMFDQESFDSFQLRVKRLAQVTIWPGVDEADIEVERMAGGRFNLIVGLSSRQSKHANRRHILRVPRSFEDGEIKAEIYTNAAAILFAQKHAGIAVPQIIKIDGTRSNAIESPYMLQERVEGGALHTTWDNFDHAQKCRLAKELGHIYRQMLSVNSSAPGTFGLPKDDLNLHAEVQVVPLRSRQMDKAPASPMPYVASAPIEDVETLLVRMFGERADSSSEDSMVDMWMLKQRMAKELAEGGWFQDVHYCLAHRDFFPRNIVADSTNGEHTSLINGVIDWDSALLAPTFVACKPPHWLWSIWSVNDESSDENMLDETGASDEPVTEETRELKSIFDEAAGETYRRFAYEPTYRVARRLFRFAIDGMSSHEDLTESERLEKEWKAFHCGCTDNDEDEDENECDEDEDEHECGEECDCDTRSDTSTVMYGQESFETYKGKVLALALESVWPGAKADEIEIERMKGGGYNRIIGLTRTSPERPHPEYEYILRQPREFSDVEESTVEQDTAILLFVQRHTTIPVPHIVQMDLEPSNSLEAPYTIQSRLKGHDLEIGYSSLSHEQKCKVAKELGRVYRQMLSIPSSTTGRFVLDDKSKGLDAGLAVIPLKTVHYHKEENVIAPVPVPYNPSATATETIIELLTKLFKSMENLLLEKFPKYPIHSEKWVSYAKMANELEAAGWFKDVDYCLGHLDLEPRNVLVDPATGADSSIVTGVLDWDIAYLMPAFAACRPPQWIWSVNKPEEEIDEDEKEANDIPPTEELQQLKLIFEEAAGPKYLRFAYEPAYRLARRLFRFAVEGHNSSVDNADAVEMLEEWNAISGGSSESDNVAPTPASE